MANDENLIPNHSRWRNAKTKAIRVPECLSEDVLQYARRLDKQETSPEAEEQTAQAIQNAIAILNESLNLKANAGGAIKKEIKKVVQLLQESQVYR